MEPEPLVAAQVGQRGQIVDRAGVDRTGGTGNAEGLQPRRAIGRDRCDQGGHAEAVFGIDRDQP